MVHVVDEALPVPCYGETAEVQREAADEDQAEPERRHGERDQRQQPDRVVGDAVAAERRGDPEREGEDDAMSVA